ncbi:MAG: hypothetical protein A2408_00085 [Candidatus Yonathbacteria bacterium RIFOXYC1_FULL_52_10]|uniref:Uncharacterized protein n=1 Tax=Candidatus Yonathbacteria bacterium RIFOXYD1_FULL_52_36 TaxID=1802730 RepID=A0A1G2SLF0_9BACT|nr:MAG: hypothetical protein A2408_00085 [Candidatus Yonathbacteria bacterium RIFOXYC1_FULL_52_10]OHA85786.1 MAG: hypothetical protein A2591_03670 [Candidatus Yonathbacteria bacterium RIFOXYD1_FULL_52_36]
MKKDADSQYFLSPKDGATNENVMADLAKTCGATEDMIHLQRPCTDGKRYDVIEVPYAFIAKMERNTREYEFKFLVFRQREGASEMEPWPFTKPKKVRRTKKVLGAKKALKNLQERRAKP